MTIAHTPTPCPKCHGTGCVGRAVAKDERCPDCYGSGIMARAALAAAKGAQ